MSAEQMGVSVERYMRKWQKERKQTRYIEDEAKRREGIRRNTNKK